MVGRGLLKYIERFLYFYFSLCAGNLCATIIFTHPSDDAEL
jgi:hypothetical protein